VARVRSAGGIATLQRLPGGDETRQSDTSVNINVRLFAKTDTGLLAIDPNPQSYAAAIPHDALKQGEAHAAIGLLFAPEFMRPELGEGRTQGPWQGVIEQLRRVFAIETDPETLQALEFEFIADRELAEELTR
jgi:hypothetical protein